METNMDQLTLSLEDTLVSLSVSPGSDQARMMTATSGQKYSALLDQSNPVGYCSKMLLDTSRWVSTTCFLTWTPSATPRNRSLFRLAPSIQSTEEIESGLWPTPTANDFKGAGMSGMLRDRLDYAVERGGTKSKQYTRQEQHGRLNPDWVEWLMGYPIGWTDCEDSETQSSHKLPL